MKVKMVLIVFVLAAIFLHQTVAKQFNARKILGSEEQDVPFSKRRSPEAKVGEFCNSSFSCETLFCNKKILKCSLRFAGMGCERDKICQSNKCVNNYCA